MSKHPNQTQGSTNIHICQVHCVSSLSPLTIILMFISLMLFITVFVPLVCYLALKKKPFIFSVYYYFTFSISIVLIECIELSFKLFFCLLAYHVQLSIGPQEQWINQVLMKIKTWRVSTAMYKLYTHLTTFPHDQF